MKKKTRTGTHGVTSPPATNRKSAAQTEGQFTRDTKGRRGQYGQAGNSPLIKK